MSDNLRTTRPTDDGGIQWREWGPEAFAEAERLNRPVLLNLTAVWCQSCRMMDQTTYAEPDLVALINQSLLPVRADADKLPHVQDRYTAGGWPTNAFLTPTGEVLWAGTFVPPEQFHSVAASVLSAWGERRDELKSEIDRRRKAMDAARSRQPAAGLVRREAADDVLTATQENFDPRHGGFGVEPKFPFTEAIELLYVQGYRSTNADWLEMADRTLDGMLAGELFDTIDGGFFRYALAPDWTAPAREKLLDTNAALLRVRTGAKLRNREDWRVAAERIVGWVENTLVQRTACGAESKRQRRILRARRRRKFARPQQRPLVEDMIYTNRNAGVDWSDSRGLGGRLGPANQLDRARCGSVRSADRRCSRTRRHTDHYVDRPRGTCTCSSLLVIVGGHPCSHERGARVVSGDADAPFLEHARRLMKTIESMLWADEGGFRDHPKSADDVGALRYTDRPFDLNAGAARTLLDLSLVTGERGYHALAERILAGLSPLAGRYGVSGASFAMAVEEFFEPPFWDRSRRRGDGSRGAARARAGRARARPPRLVALTRWPHRKSLARYGGPRGRVSCGPRASSGRPSTLEVARSVR